MLALKREINRQLHPEPMHEIYYPAGDFKKQRNGAFNETQSINLINAATGPS
jgi:hypothetical protein